MADQKPISEMTAEEKNALGKAKMAEVLQIPATFVGSAHLVAGKDMLRITFSETPNAPFSIAVAMPFDAALGLADAIKLTVTQASVRSPNAKAALDRVNKRTTTASKSKPNG